MATRATVAARNVNGEYISPDARLSAFGDTSRYTLEFTIENAADLTNVNKSLSIYIEYLDETSQVWLIGCGAHWKGGSGTDKLGAPVTPGPVFTMGSWTTLADDTLLDPLRGARVRLRATTPAEDPNGNAIYPGTSGVVRVSARILDERAS